MLAKRAAGQALLSKSRGGFVEVGSGRLHVICNLVDQRNRERLIVSFQPRGNPFQLLELVADQVSEQEDKDIFCQQPVVNKPLGVDDVR